MLFLSKKHASVKKKFSMQEAKKIGDSIGMLWNQTDLNQFRVGLEVELEHINPQFDLVHGDLRSLGKIVAARLREDSNYYTLFLSNKLPRSLGEIKD